MSTFAERKQWVCEMLEDPDLHLTRKEIFEYLYHWYKYEIAVRRATRSWRSMKKQAVWLDATKDVYAFRRDLNKV